MTASVISDEELHPDYIIPSVFDRRVAKAVAKAVSQKALDTGSARRQQKSMNVASVDETAHK